MTFGPPPSAKTFPLMIVLFLAGGFLPAHAQNEEQSKACRKAYLASGFPAGSLTEEPCADLRAAIRRSIGDDLDAAALETRQSASQALEERLTPRDFQIPQGQVGNDAGTPTQGGSAPSIQSVALAGGNLAAAGTENGTRTLATAVLNPASLFGAPASRLDNASDEKDSLTVALSNLGDVTFIAPIEDIEREGALDYLGVRARVNVTSLVQGTESFQKVEKQWLNTLRSSGDLARQISSAINSVLDEQADSATVATCTQALLQVPEMGIQAANAACNAELESLSLTQEDFARLRTLTEEALAEADEEYFGLDLRLDLGDPTLGVADSARGTRLYTGVAWGHRYGEATSARTTIRLNGGVRFIDLDVMDEAVFAAEGGFDLAFSKIVEKQRLQGSAGLSFSAGNVGEAFERAAETNCLRGQLSVSVPLAQNFGLSINFTTPIIGDVGTTLSVKTNWHLLLPGSN